MKRILFLVLACVTLGFMASSQETVQLHKQSIQKMLISKDSPEENLAAQSTSKFLKNRSDVFTENFDTWPLSNWQIDTTNVNYPWEENSYGIEGSCVNISHDPDAQPHDEWLISSPVQMPDTHLTMYFDFMTSVYWHIEPNDNADICFVISTDSGLTWSDPLWQEDDEQLCTQSFSWPWETWEWKRAYFNLSQYAGQTICLGFHYLGQNAAQFKLDNVCIYETPPHNIYQTELIPGFFYTNFGSFTLIPDEHTIDTVDCNGIMFVSEVMNMGINTEHVSLKVDIVHDGDTVFSHIGDTLELDPFSYDSVGFVDPAFYPGDLQNVKGNYTMYYEVVIDSSDADLSDNVMELSFEVTDSIYARDTNPTDTSGAMTGWYGDNNGVSYDGDRWGVYYYIAKDGNPADLSTAVFSLSVYVHDDTEVGATVIAKIWDGETQGRPELISSQEHIITEADLGGWIQIPFEMNGGQEFLSQGIILAGVETYGPDFWIGSDNTIPHFKHTAFIYHAEEQTWYYVTDDLPMIRLNFGYPVINNNIDNQILAFSIDQNIPNPCDASTFIAFEIAKSSDVLFSVFDITGQCVFQQKDNFKAGMNTIELSTSEFDNGIYTYQIKYN